MQTINLLPQQYVKREKNKALKSIVGIVIAVELGITGVTALIPIKTIQDKKQYIAHIEERLQDVRFDEVKAMQVALDQEIENYEQWSGRIMEMKQLPFISDNLLDTLLGNIPVGVSIDQLEMQEQNQFIKIEGKTVSVFALMGYITKLEGIYEQVEIQFDLGEIKLDKGYNQFEMTMQWKQVENSQESIEAMEDSQDE
ncbi:MAG: hypothetical protein ACRC1P_07180 [Cellulosilyticaceae bacterium]